MQSIFEFKTHIPFDADRFGITKKVAKEVLENAEKCEYTQAIALHTSSGKNYCAVIFNATSKDKIEEKALLELMKNDGSTRVESVLCMWQDGCIDVPSFAFRKMLCDADGQNSDATVFVMTKDGPAAVKLESIMK